MGTFTAQSLQAYAVKINKVKWGVFMPKLGCRSDHVCTPSHLMKPLAGRILLDSWEQSGTDLHMWWPLSWKPGSPTWLNLSCMRRGLDKGGTDLTWQVQSDLLASDGAHSRRIESGWGKGCCPQNMWLGTPYAIEYYPAVSGSLNTFNSSI